MCCMCLLVHSLGLQKYQCTWSALLGGFISIAAGFIHKWQRGRTVLSSFGCWGQNADLPLGPNKQIRIHAVEGHGSPHIYTNLLMSHLLVNLWQQFFWDTDGLLICILEKQLLLIITQNQHSSYSMSWSRKTDESCHLRSFDFFTKMHQRTSHWLLWKVSTTVNLFN